VPGTAGWIHPEQVLHVPCPDVLGGTSSVGGRSPSALPRPQQRTHPGESPAAADSEAASKHAGGYMAG